MYGKRIFLQLLVKVGRNLTLRPICASIALQEDTGLEVFMHFASLALVTEPHEDQEQEPGANVQSVQFRTSIRNSTSVLASFELV